MPTPTDLPGQLMRLLADTTESDDVYSHPDLQLYGSGLLDSLGTVTLMAACDEKFGVRISPAEFDQQAWATPRAFVADIERRLAAVHAGRP